VGVCHVALVARTAAKRSTQEIEGARQTRTAIRPAAQQALYLKALISGLFDGPAADDAIRKRLTEEADTLGSTMLHTAVLPPSIRSVRTRIIRTRRPPHECAPLEWSSN